MKAVVEQLHFELKKFNYEPIETIFIGGGTPSTIAPELYIELFNVIKEYLENECEITVEANPNSATLEWLDGMQKLGVNRVSFGTQSFNDEKLKLLGRSHRASDAINAIKNASKVGFEHISLDLIYNVDGDTLELIKEDLQTSFSLPIDHISAYSLIIEEHTVFEKKEQMSKESEEITEYLFRTIKEHGFEHYEISNFGKYHSKHNIGYWKYKDYMGVGAGAVGFLKDERYYPLEDILSYIKTPLQQRIECLSEEDILIEKIFLGLRSYVGFSKEILTSEQLDRATLLVKEKKLLFKNDTFYNTNYLISDEIALFLTD